MSLYSISDFSDLPEVEIIEEDPGMQFSELAYDSRKIRSKKYCLFFALKGESRDGHRFLEKAHKMGVRQFVISDKTYVSSLSNSNIFLVPDVKDALQFIAKKHRQHFDLPIVGITGSNGKTIVKEWLNQLLASDYRIVRNPRSFNSQIGVPLSLWNINATHELGIFEAGISKLGEMEKLADIIRAKTGIFINIGSAHQENFESKDQTAEEKAKLFVSCDKILHSADYPEIIHALSPYASIEKHSWSMHTSADLRLIETHQTESGLLMEMDWKGESFEVEIPFTDKASIENAMACILFCLDLGIDKETISERCPKLNAVEMRLETKAGIQGSILINDSYNSDIHSLSIALAHLDSLSHGKKKILILSDIVQSGMSPENLQSLALEMLSSGGPDEIYTVGSLFQAVKFKIPHQHYKSTDELIKAIDPAHFAGVTVLIKGAREFEFERVVSRLEAKAHSTVLEIDLDKMSHNLAHFRNQLRPDTRIMSMVKAFSYGSGSHEVASHLEFSGVDYLAVAYTDEAIELRKSGISLPILILNPDKSSLSALKRYRLEPEVYSLELLDSLSKLYTNKKDPLPIHLKIDTGMHRLGFRPEEILKITEILRKSEGLQVKSVFSHLAASENVEEDHFTKKQIQTFSEVCAKLESLLGHSFLRHISNTAGILRHPEAEFEMVRLGIGLYGIDPSGTDDQLLPVSRLISTVSQVKKLQKGESVGYGRAFVAQEACTIATIPIGYADGYRRSLGLGKAKVQINGKLWSVVGQVCMDMIMVDVTGSQVAEGSEVVVFGDSPSIYNLSEWMDTIPYEVLTSISPRVKRVFLRE